MARKPAKFDGEADEVPEAEIVLEEPGPDKPRDIGEKMRDKSVWMRGLQMLIVAVLTSFAVTLLGLSALLQFGWLLLAGRRNDHIAGFGRGLSGWLAGSARFQTAVTEEKPFPWSAWPKG
ncbi:MAG: DUF4389 domain-containing protein [Rhodobacteraceae bacterium]|nr:DUF4389 domain-containing protein [Paracoccaceae bacterium]